MRTRSPHCRVMNHHLALLEELGGYVKVAQRLGISKESTRKWQERGIPPQHWHRVIRLKPSLTPEWLAKTKPKPARRKR